MKTTLFASLALAVGLMAPVAAQTPDAPAAPIAAAAPAQHGNRVNGSVTAVSGNAVTVQERNATTPTTFTLAPDATVTKMAPAAVADITTGNTVQVNGTVTDTTVEARSITILMAAPKGTPRGRSVVGTVATTTPSLTVTGTDGKTYTVTTATARVMKTVAGAAADITVGENINARVNGGDPTKLIASQVNIMPARAARRGRRNRGATATAPVVAPAAPAPAAP